MYVSYTDHTIWPGWRTGNVQNTGDGLYGKCNRWTDEFKWEILSRVSTRKGPSKDTKEDEGENLKMGSYLIRRLISILETGIM